MEISTKTFSELDKLELYQLLALRAEVFVVEQDCAYQDVDGKDLKALHVIGKNESGIVAYARIFGPGDYFDHPSIGRILVQKNFRSSGYGRKIVLAAQEAIKKHFDTEKIQLSAQLYLKEFYEELGYKPSGEEYLEDGIPHIMMIKD